MNSDELMRDREAERTEEVSVYPEHDKLRAIKSQSQAIGEFLDWLSGEGWHRMRWDTLTDRIVCTAWNCEDGYTFGDQTRPCRACGAQGYTDIQRQTWITDTRPIDALLAEYFDIDLGKVEQEKRAMIDAIRKANNS